ncbi:MAG: FKBP-type peptidyl-prolyl cis-trans isomerase [Candidatus Nanohaloarchaeota archaeon QJJ-9]|nr:FKBP-type peptidyl-prolyl cis-trans isomerase [Candidatus Nanohaloarchaeota archaeon QJJ-9]
MEENDVVEINYVGRVKSTGKVFDLTDREIAEEEDIDTQNMDLGPVKILIGGEYVIEGLEDAIKGMKVGEEKEIEVTRQKAFGSRKSDNIETVAEKEFKEYDITPRRGMTVEVDGRRGKVIASNNGRVKVDFNHPLAGKDLEYEVEVLRKIKELKEKVEAVMDYHAPIEYEINVEGEKLTVEIEEELPKGLKSEVEEDIEQLDEVENAEIEETDTEEDSD